MANAGNGPNALSDALARIVNQVTDSWTSEEDNQWGWWQQFGLLWLGAMTFTWPLFMLHFEQVLERQFSGTGYEVIGLIVAGTATSGIVALLPAWLATTKRKGQPKVRLFLTGFLLPYVVVGLLLPLLQTSGGTP